MEFFADWQPLNNPAAATYIASFIAVATIVALAVPVYRTARKVGRFKPQSFLLLVLPALVIVGGVTTDDYRAAHHQEQLTASGATSNSWLELEDRIQEKYNVGKITPVGDTAETLDAVKAAASGSTNVSNVSDPKVSVQHPDSTHTEIYRIVVTPSEGGSPDISLARQQSLELAGEGADPEAFRIK